MTSTVSHEFLGVSFSWESPETTSHVRQVREQSVDTDSLCDSLCECECRDYSSHVQPGNEGKSTWNQMKREETWQTKRTWRTKTWQDSLLSLIRRLMFREVEGTKVMRWHQEWQWRCFSQDRQKRRRQTEKKKTDKIEGVKAVGWHGSSFTWFPCMSPLNQSLSWSQSHFSLLLLILVWHDFLWFPFLSDEWFQHQRQEREKTQERKVVKPEPKQNGSSSISLFLCFPNNSYNGKVQHKKSRETYFLFFSDNSIIAHMNKNYLHPKDRLLLRDLDKDQIQVFLLPNK
jgi:hypothetical protein